MSSSDGAMGGQSGLDAAGRAWGIEAVLTINIVTCSLSLVGSLVMIVPFFVSKHLRKVRHRMILGLAINDFVQAVAVLIPSAILSNSEVKRMRTNSPGCIADSFFYLAMVVAGCFWALAIALTTYITLVRPLSRTAIWFQQVWAMPAIWCGIWLVSFINAAIGAAIVPSIDAGGFCFFSSVPPSLYGNLIIFIPRSAVFLVIIILYVRLYLFFRRQSKRAKHTESYTPSDDISAPWPTPITLDQLSPLSVKFDKMEGSPSPARRSSVTYAPVYRVDSLGAKLSQYQIKPDFDRKGSKDSDATLVFDSVSSARAKLALRRSLSRPEMVINETSEEGISVMQDSEAILNNDRGFETQLRAFDEGVATKAPRLAHAGFGSPRLSASDDADRDRMPVPDTSTYRFPATLPTAALSAPAPSPPASEPTEITLARKETAASKNADIGLWEALAATEPSPPKDGELGAYLATGRRMSASEENKRASYLMIAYPLAYAVIVTVSLARLLSTIVTGFPPSPVLQILNRILILSMGLVDAILYCIIEWRLRAGHRAASR